jgi:hypothetical protein
MDWEKIMTKKQQNWLHAVFVGLAIIGLVIQVGVVLLIGIVLEVGYIWYLFQKPKPRQGGAKKAAKSAPAAPKATAHKAAEPKKPANDETKPAPKADE